MHLLEIKTVNGKKEEKKTIFWYETNSLLRITYISYILPWCSFEKVVKSEKSGTLVKPLILIRLC